MCRIKFLADLGGLLGNEQTHERKNNFLQKRVMTNTLSCHSFRSRDHWLSEGENIHPLLSVLDIPNCASSVHKCPCIKQLGLQRKVDEVRLVDIFKAEGTL